MNRLMTALFSGIIVSGLYDPFVAAIMFSMTVVGVASILGFRLYKNRLKPLPVIKIQKEKQLTVPTGSTTIEREMKFVSQKVMERALDNGYTSVRDVPEKLKI